MSFSRTQKTLKREISISGISLFSGEKTIISLIPAPENHGILFQRVDIPKKPTIFADLKYVHSFQRTTFLKNDEMSIQTIEHLLSALAAYSIDNLLIKVNGSEIPIGDGSASLFVEALEKAGIEQQSLLKEGGVIESPQYWSEGDTQLIALPSDEYRISYTLHYPHSSFLNSQFYTFVVDQESYKAEIAPSRTFSLYEEIEPLLEKNLIRGGSLKNAIIIKDDKVMNTEGIRFENEMARHKILDLIGDLSLIGTPFLAHIVAIRSGHLSNIQFAKKLQKYLKKENI